MGGNFLDDEHGFLGDDAVLGCPVDGDDLYGFSDGYDADLSVVLVDYHEAHVVEGVDVVSVGGSQAGSHCIS